MGDNLVRKILKKHLVEGELKTGEEIGIRIDQVLTQDTTGTMAYLQFEAMGLPRIKAKLAASYADHQTYQFNFRNTDDHQFIQSAARKFGAYFSRPGNGVCHQVHRERFARPGETLLGADSHTQTAGGVGMVSVGAGGLDVAVAMGGGLYYLVMPKVVKVSLKGELGPWVTAKDIQFEILRQISVKGGTGKAFEFVGPGADKLNVPQRCTITNFCTEVGATTSIFSSDAMTKDFLRRHRREDQWEELLPDPDAEYDEEMEIDLSTLEPMVAAPRMPDNVLPISELEGTPIHQVIVGSCTNGSYTDLVAFAKIIRGKHLDTNVACIIVPASKQTAELMAREGYVAELMAAGVNWSEATCGPCIGVGHVPATGWNSFRTYNRNFKGRSGVEEDSVYLGSPEIAAVCALTGKITDPRKLGWEAPPIELAETYDGSEVGILPPASEEEAKGIELIKGPNIGTVPAGRPLPDSLSADVLLKVGDDITTDHIMPARADILQFRSNIPKLSEYTMARIDEEFAARAIEKGGGWIIGGDNYGQGSSREHAALCPMFLGVVGVIAKSFARIHKANLINFGLLPLEFENLSDYDSIEQGHKIEITGLIDKTDGKTEFAAENKTTGKTFKLKLEATDRERTLIKAGGKLAHTKAQGVG